MEGFRKIAEHGEAFRMNLLDDFLTASNLAGIAFGNAGTGAVHAMSYPSKWCLSCYTRRSELSVPYSGICKISGIRSEWQNKGTK